MKELIEGFKSGMNDGIEKIASDIPKEDHQDFIEKCAEEFERLISITGMEKEASMADFVTGFAGKAPGLAGAAGGIANKAVTGLAVGGLAGLANIAVNKVSGMYGNAEAKSAYERAFRQAVQGSEILREADSQKVRRMADSIYSFAPTVASDSNVLANILSNAIYGDTIDLQTVRAVTELEEKLSKIKG